MAPAHTAVSVKLTEPCGTEAERARARRRRAARRVEDGPAAHAPSGSRPSSRHGSRTNSRSNSPGPNDVSTTDAFVPPGPSRHGRSQERGQSEQRNRSESRRRLPSGLDLITGSGTAEEAEEADEPPPATLRGLLTLSLSKPTRIREIHVRFRGLARTEWPEGIGPRRMDVLEETILLTNSWSLFTAANLPNERRAASLGPSTAPMDDGERRGRPARRSASVMPVRDSSTGRLYPSRDSAIHEEDPTPTSPPLDNRPSRSTALSRIASSSDMVPPIEPGEPTPSYEEAVASPPGSPIAGPSALEALPTDTFQLAGGRARPGRLERSPTPSRSPLGPNRLEYSPSPSRQSTIASRLSEEEPDEITSQRPSLQHQDSTASSTNVSPSPATSYLGSSDIDNVLSSGASSLNGVNGVVRPPAAATRDDSPTPSASTTLPTSSPLQRQPSGSPRPSSVRRSSNASNTSIPAPNGRKPSMSTPRGASSKPSARFSLGGLADALRGKSVSRARDPNGSLDIPGKPTARRSESPDARAYGSNRSQSRGRKTALKVLRNALTTADGRDGGGEGDVDSDDEMDDDKIKNKGWKEFKAGTYTYPISFPVSASLPPTITADFGSVFYTLKATVHRAGALTSNLSAVTEVLLVSCPSQDDTEENESIVVERFWETQMKYHIALSGKSFPIGGTIPICVRLNPLAKVKLYRITVILEQKTNYFGSGRKLTRHETPKKFTILKVEMPDTKQPLLPILSDDVNILRDHPLSKFFINPTSSDDTTPSLLDPIGPWNLESILKLPDCDAKIGFSTSHEKANIAVTHVLKIMLRVERGDDDFLDSKGKRKLWDVIVESPVHILSCRCANQNTLPAYTSTAPTLSGTNSGSANSSSSFGMTSDPGAHGCGIEQSAGPSGRIAGAAANLQAMATAPPTRSGRSPSAHQSTPTLAENLLFARLISGEEGPSGETPPTYDTVVTGQSGQSQRDRSNSSSGTMRGRQRRSSSVMSEHRGRSETRGRAQLQAA